MPRTLLLADDSVTIQKVVGISFANEDVQLVTVDNGDDAIARARETRPDIVLADVVMPGLNGYEVCEAIKRDPELASIPVLLLTGTFEAFDEARARDAGADGHITKPFEAQALVDEVNERLASSHPANAAAPEAAPDLIGKAPEASISTDDAYDFFDADSGEGSDLSDAVEAPAASTTLLLGDDAAGLPAARAAGDDDATTTLFGGSDFANAETSPPVDPSDELSIEPGGGESFPPIDDVVGVDDPSEPLLSVDEAPFPAVAASPSFGAGSENLPADSGSVTAEPFGSPDTSTAEPVTPALIDPDPALAALAPPTMDSDALGAPEEMGLELPAQLEEHSIDPVAGDFSDPLVEPAESASSVLDPAGGRNYDVSSSDLGDSFSGAASPTSDDSFSGAASPTSDDSFSGAASPTSDDSFSGAASPASDDSFTRSMAAAPGVDAPLDASDPFAGFDAPYAGDSDPGPFAEPLAAETGIETEPVLADPDAEPEARPTGGSPLSPMVREEMRDALEKVAWEAFGDVTERIVRDAVARMEQVAWEVIPQMAEALIREEIRRLKGEDE